MGEERLLRERRTAGMVWVEGWINSALVFISQKEDDLALTDPRHLVPSPSSVCSAPCMETLPAHSSSMGAPVQTGCSLFYCAMPGAQVSREVGSVEGGDGRGPRGTADAICVRSLEASIYGRWLVRSFVLLEASTLASSISERKHDE